VKCIYFVAIVTPEGLGPMVVLIHNQSKTINIIDKKLNSVACVRERTILNERPLLVGEVSANIYG
jgi:hypothetical protein